MFGTEKGNGSKYMAMLDSPFMKLLPDGELKEGIVFHTVMEEILTTDPMRDHLILFQMDHIVVIVELSSMIIGLRKSQQKQMV